MDRKLSQIKSWLPQIKGWLSKIKGLVCATSQALMLVRNGSICIQGIQPSTVYRGNNMSPLIRMRKILSLGGEVGG